MSHRWNVLGLAGTLALALSVSFCSDNDDDPTGEPTSANQGAAGAAPTKGAGGTGGAAGAGQGGAGGGAAGAGAAGAGAAGAADVDLTAADFTCILDWPKVRGFRITNKAGPVQPSLDAANQVGTVDYPFGTVIQLVPNEAMV
ncbi:MAG TPA: hypothetical protein VFS00_09240, partial [Polyangiaceae bacterium]|nr:hypothetical protein [Polyangiaceae bacterium]